MTAGSAPKWRRLEPDERREQIFTCAAELFGERPYAAVSTADIAARDAYDQSRTHDPLAAAPDAVHIDTSELSIDEVVAAIEELVK